MSSGSRKMEVAVDWLMPIGDAEKPDHYVEALQSIFDQIGFGNDRVILVCNSMIFGHVSSVFPKEKFIWVASPKKRNAAAFRNKGLEQVEGEVLFFHDSDDISLPTRRGKTLTAMQNVDLVSSGYLLIDERSRSIGSRALSKVSSCFFFRNNFPLPALAVNAALLNDMSFNETLDMGEDTVFIADLIGKGGAWCLLPQPILAYRIIDDKISRRRGLKALRMEIKFRSELLRRGSCFQKGLCVLGGLVVGLSKVVPLSIFRAIYLNVHKR